MTEQAYGLCQCGCGENTKPARRTDSAKGWTRGEPLKYVRGHNNRLSPVAYAVDGNGCWVWLRSKFPTGYGKVRGGRYAHRFFYEQHKGAIPDGLVIDHLCRNRACVNPDHLEAVTQRENVRRGHRWARQNGVTQ